MELHSFPDEPDNLQQKVKNLIPRLKSAYQKDKITFILITILVVIILAGIISWLWPRGTTPDTTTDLSSPTDITTPSPSDDLFETAAPTVTSSVEPTATVSPVSNSKPDQAHSSLSANPTSVSADGQTQSSITVTLRDSNNNPVPGLAVSLATGDSSAVINPLSTGSNVTDLSGIATFSITSTSSGTKNVSVVATSSGGTSTTLTNLGTVTFTALATPTPIPTATP